MNRKLFKIILIPMYLLIGLWMFCIMIDMSDSLNFFFYFITLMFVPSACLLSLPNSKSHQRKGMIGFIVLGFLLPVTQSLEFEFQGFNGWILLGMTAIISGVGGFIYQSRRNRSLEG